MESGRKLKQNCEKKVENKLPLRYVKGNVWKNGGNCGSAQEGGLVSGDAWCLKGAKMGRWLRWW